MRSPALAAALVVAALLTATGGRIPAAAQDPRPEVGILVTSLTRVLGPGAPGVGEGSFPADLMLRLLVENTGEAAVSDLRAVVEVFDRVVTRSALHAALDGDHDSRLLAFEDVLVRDGGGIPPGDAAGIMVTVEGSRLGWTVPAGRSGVYPVRISVLLGTEVLDRVSTAVTFAERGLAPLQTVMVWPLDTVPWRGVGGAYDRGVAEAVEPGGRLDRLLAVLERRPDAPVLVRPAVHLLEDLADRADGFRERVRGSDGTLQVQTVTPEELPAQRSARFLERLRAVLAALPHDPVVGAYADADLAALLTGDEPLPAEAGRAVSHSRERLEVLAGRAPDRQVFVPAAPLDRATLGVLTTAGIRTLLLHWQDVLQPALGSLPELPPAVRTLTAPTGQALTAIVADPWVEEALTAPAGEHGPIIASQRVVAETAMIVMEAPYRSGRALLLLPPPGWDPDPRTADHLLGALMASPWLRFTDPTTQVGEASRTRAAALAARPADAGPVTGLLGALATTRDQLTVLREALLDLDGPIDGRSFEELDLQLLRAASWWWRGDPDGLALVRDVRDAVAEAFGDVSVPADATVTLTSESGFIPVTLQRSRGLPIRVLVTLASPRLTFPDGAVQPVELAGARARTRSFRVVTRSTGTFSVRVLVTDATGTVELAERTMSVRSTAISGPALLVTGGVVAALLLAGLRRLRAPRRHLRLVGDGRR